MTCLPDWLPLRFDADADCHVVGERDVEAAGEVSDVGNKGECVLVVHRPADSLFVNFALLQARHRDPVHGRLYSLVFHGYGPGGALREMRHTWWGEDGGGYLFYAPGAEIAEALRLLGQWFDDMPEEKGGAPLTWLYAVADGGGKP